MSVNFIILDAGMFDYYWECSGCKKRFKATKKIESAKYCPNCGDTIDKWVGDNDEVEE